MLCWKMVQTCVALNMYKLSLFGGAALCRGSLGQTLCHRGVGFCIALLLGLFEDGLFTYALIFASFYACVDFGGCYSMTRCNL